MTTPTLRVVGFVSPCMPIVVELEKPVKMIELRKVVVAALRSVHPRVYYEDAPEKTEYPYLVYRFLPTSIDEGTTERFILDVDGWDVPGHGDTTAIEVLMDLVDAALNRLVKVTDSGLRAVFYRERRFPVEDDDTRIVRRKAVYEVRTFEERRRYHG